jgi:hypothetical protein
MSISEINAQKVCTAFLTFSCAGDTDIIYLAIASHHRQGRSTFKEIESMLCTIKQC